MTKGISIPSLFDRPGAHLLFFIGNRPDLSEIDHFVEAHPLVSLSHYPGAGGARHAVGQSRDQVSVASKPSEVSENEWIWVELLRDGMTFDLAGMAPGRLFPVPESEYRFDCDKDTSSCLVESLRLVPGPHLKGAEGRLPVLRGLLALARDLVQHFERIEAVAWPPSRSVIGRRFFESSCTAWLDGGPFPALGLTAFRETIDGGLQSVGLNFLIGQELRIEPGLCADKVAATRLGVRLVNHFVLAGPLDRTELITGPTGQRLHLEASTNGKYVRVREA